MNVQKIPTSVNISVSTLWAHTGEPVGLAIPSPRMDSAASVIAILCVIVVNIHNKLQ